MCSQRILSDGANRLRAAGSLPELVTRTGLSKSVLCGLRTGSVARPSAAAARVIEDVLGIPAAAFEVFADAEPPAEGQPAAHEPDSDADDLLPAANPHDVLRRAKRHLDALEARGSAPPRDLAMALSEYRRAVELVRKTSDQDAEGILQDIFDALKAFPDAREAVAAALESRGNR